MQTKEKNAYLAGLIDGEGTISVRRMSNNAKSASGKRIYYVVDVRIYNTHKGVMRWVQKNYGGLLMWRKRRKPQYKDSYIWFSNNVDIAIALLQMAYPYLIIKKKQAQLGMKLLTLQLKSRDTRNTMYAKVHLCGESILRTLWKLNLSRGRKKSALRKQ